MVLMLMSCLPERHGLDDVAGEATVSGLLLAADRGPRVALGVEPHESRDGVDGGDAVRAALLGRRGDHHDVGHVGGQLGEERHLHGLSHLGIFTIGINVINTINLISALF